MEPEKSRKEEFAESLLWWCFGYGLAMLIDFVMTGSRSPKPRCNICGGTSCCRTTTGNEALDEAWRKVVKG